MGDSSLTQSVTRNSPWNSPTSRRWSLGERGEWPATGAAPRGQTLHVSHNITHRGMEDKSWKTLWAWTLLSIPILGGEIARAANILAVFPLATRSHNNVFFPVTKALAHKGHRLTLITCQPIDSPPPNYRQIDVSHLVLHHFDEINVSKNLGLITMVNNFLTNTVEVCREVMELEEVMELADPGGGEKYDLIILSNFFTECFYPFAHFHDAPIVLISPAGPLPYTQAAVGNVVLPSFYPEVALAFGDRMDFMRRSLSTVASVTFWLVDKYYFRREIESEMRTAFGEDVPTISDLEERISLVVINNHFSLNQARPTVPCLIEAGGLHIKPPEALPKDIKSFLDSAAKDGVIYFSLGSVLKSYQYPKETRDAFVEAFSRVKQRVLWKWEGETPIPGQTKNVRPEKWLPQQDVLAHPNVKLFITHGGLLSLQEAVSRGVSLIGIPYYGDQEFNMNRVTDLEIGVRLDKGNLTAGNILNAIDEILGNPSYSQNAKKLKSIVMDQKDHPLERAVYWIEYVIRHNGAKHLKPAAFHLQWYQICMLDVLFVLVVIPLSIASVMAVFAVKMIKKRRRSKGQTVISTKKLQ